MDDPRVGSARPAWGHRIPNMDQQGSLETPGHRSRQWVPFDHPLWRRTSFALSPNPPSPTARRILRENWCIGILAHETSSKPLWRAPWNGTLCDIANTGSLSPAYNS